MKDPLNRTKVVLRHLPPSISQSALMDQIDGKFSGRYKWFSFRPGKISQKNQRYSRAYIDFQSPDDVIEFAEFFDGHIFVNEKGSQFKALVEYAPSQHVPKLLSKKDGREGTIFKDAEYVQFLESIAKHENLPSAEIQLERKEAERAGGLKEAVIITPLMEFIRQKRAARSGSQRSSINGKVSRRTGGASGSISSTSKRGSEKRRGPPSVYVLKDSAKSSSSNKEKSAYMLASRKEDQQSVLAKSGVSEVGNASNGAMPAASGSLEIGKGKVMLLKAKERDVSHVSGGSSQQQNSTGSVRNLTGLISNQSPREASGRIIRSILSNKDARPGQLTGLQHDHQKHEVNSERDKRPPRPPNPRLILKDHTTSDRNEKRLRNKDRPDRSVWTPRRSDGSHHNEDANLSAQQLPDSSENISQQNVGPKDMDDVMGSQIAHGGNGNNSRATHDAPLGPGNADSRSGRANMASPENGMHRHVGRRGPAHGMKEVDGSQIFSDGKSSKRGVSAGYASHEKQVWVQKSGSGS